VVAIAAVQLGFMLGGSIVIETVFALHGVGYLGWESIAKNDFPGGAGGRAGARRRSTSA
jgi:peptide/nickel transport system permease protein